MEEINILKTYTGREVLTIINYLRKVEHKNMIKTLGRIKCVDKATLKNKSLQQSKTAIKLFDSKGVFPTNTFQRELIEMGFIINWDL